VAEGQPAPGRARASTARLALEGEPDQGDAALVVHLSREPERYARELYRALHELDAGPDAGPDAEARFERIVVTLPPREPAWEAVHDRLRRAAAPPEG
jgi:hypothetical protein